MRPVARILYSLCDRIAVRRAERAKRNREPAKGIRRDIKGAGPLGWFRIAGVTHMKRWTIAVMAFLAGATVTQVAAGHQAAATPRVYQSPTGTTLRVLVDHAVLNGSEVELGELTFTPNTDSGDHQHGVTETFYVLEGELEHVVNGNSVKLTPGMVGSVRPPDKVRHKTGPAGAKALVIWAPGGEIARVTARWRAQ
jgi:quercetin dioxygenase-like cupin family protein